MEQVSNSITESVSRHVTDYLSENELRDTVDFFVLATGPVEAVEKVYLYLSLRPEKQFDDPEILRVVLDLHQILDFLASPESSTAFCNRWITQLVSGESDWADDLPLMKTDEQGYFKLDQLLRKELDGRRCFDVDIDQSARFRTDPGFVFEVGFSLERCGEGVESYRSATVHLNKMAFLDMIREDEFRREVVELLLDRLATPILLKE